MVRNEEGGVRTKKIIATIAIFALVLTAGAFMLGTSEDVDAASSEIRGDTNVVKVSGSLDYELLFFEAEEFSTLDIRYSAALRDSKGNSVGSVSPSSGSLYNGVTSSITVKAPSTPGKFTLVVTFTEKIDDKDEVKSEKSLTITVVKPITLKTTLMNNSKVDFTNFAVYFYVDNELIEESRTLVSVKSGEETNVSFDWITDTINDGSKHTFKIVPGSENIGDYTDVILGGEHTFYAGHSDYGLPNIIMAILIIVMLLLLIYISRKQVKNYGKPKSRR